MSPLKRSIAELQLLTLDKSKKVFYIGHNKDLIRYTKSMLADKKTLTVLSLKNSPKTNSVAPHITKPNITPQRSI